MLDESTHQRLDTPVAALCPVCGLPFGHDVTRRAGRIVTSELICAMGHLWTTKWVAA